MSEEKSTEKERNGKRVKEKEQKTGENRGEMERLQPLHP